MRAPFVEQVETLLKTQDPPTAPADPSRAIPHVLDTTAPNRNQHAAATANFNVANPSIGLAADHDVDRWRFNGESPQTQNVAAPPMDDFNFNSNIAMGMNNVGSNFTWEMIGLGLEEPLPPQETIDELSVLRTCCSNALVLTCMSQPSNLLRKDSPFSAYDSQVQISSSYELVWPPLLPNSYAAAAFIKNKHTDTVLRAPNQRPPVALRYAMWTLACSITEKYLDLKDLFYQRARKYVEADYIKGYGEHMISVAHAQTHVLLASYEFKMMYFPRAWMSTGSAVRLCQM